MADTPFELVTMRNAEQIAGLVNKDGGIILIVNFCTDGLPSLPISIEYFVDPTIRLNEGWIEAAKRKVNMVDREYRFSYARPNDVLFRLFEQVPIGDKYAFTIGYQASVRRSFMFINDTTLFVRSADSLPVVLEYMFTTLPFAKALGLTAEDVQKLVPYMVDDLKTKAVLKRNIDAGQAAAKK